MKKIFAILASIALLLAGCAQSRPEATAQPDIQSLEEGSFQALLPVRSV